MEKRTPSIRNLLLVGVLLTGVLLGTRVATALDVGEEAPNFTLPSTLGTEISLRQFRGKQFVLLEFYGADFSPVWVANLAARKADYSRFQALNIQILGISVDNPFSQKVQADSLQLPYPLLSDEPMKVTRTYGVVYGLTGAKIDNPHMEGRIAGRAFFLLDKQGIVRGKWIGEDLAVFPNDVLLKAAQEVAEKP